MRTPRRAYHQRQAAARRCDPRRRSGAGVPPTVPLSPGLRGSLSWGNPAPWAMPPRDTSRGLPIPTTGASTGGEAFPCGRKESRDTQILSGRKLVEVVRNALIPSGESTSTTLRGRAPRPVSGQQKGSGVAGETGQSTPFTPRQHSKVFKFSPLRVQALPGGRGAEGYRHGAAWPGQRRRSSAAGKRCRHRTRGLS